MSAAALKRISAAMKNRLGTTTKKALKRDRVSPTSCYTDNQPQIGLTGQNGWM